MEKLNSDELRFIHNKMIEYYGGVPGERNSGMVDYVCEKPFLIMFERVQSPDIFKVAAILMYAIARGHYFIDGNKRTASMAAYTFLLKNNYALVVSNDEFYTVTQKVATGNLSEIKLAKWLKNNSHFEG